MKIYFSLAALAALILVPELRAQPSAPGVQNRLLLIFDTSSDMKRRLPAEEKSVEQLSYKLFGQFQRGDSIGVWTFSRNLHTGEFPLEQWNAGEMPTLESNIMTFVKSQRYSKTTSFDDLSPTLNEVVRHSERLTTLIFCDGEGQITGTPNDDAINTVFRKNAETMRKARQPFVIVLRSQLGKFVGCTINSADAIQLPQFPPLPPPPQPVVVPPPEPAPPPPEPAPLVIIGTHVGTNVPPPAPPTPVPAKSPVVHPSQTPAPAPLPVTARAQTTTNPAPVDWTLPHGRGSVETSTLPASNSVVMISPAPIESQEGPAANTNVVLQTAAPFPPAAAPEAPAPQQRIARTIKLDGTQTASIGIIALLAIGTGLLFVTVLLVFIIMWLLRRRASPSLITESLKKN